MVLQTGQIRAPAADPDRFVEARGDSEQRLKSPQSVCDEQTSAVSFDSAACHVESIGFKRRAAQQQKTTLCLIMDGTSLSL